MLSKLRQSWSIDSFKTSFAGILLVANTFVWFLYSCRILSETITASNLSVFQSTLVWSLTILGTVGASVFGFYISNNPRIKGSFITYWMLAGIPLSLMPLVLDITVFLNLTVFFSLVGVYFGLGMPISLAYFASVTKEINRSRLGGVTFLAIFMGVIFLSALGVTNPAINGVVLANIKIIGLIVVFKVKPNENYTLKKEEEVSYKQVLKNRTFIMYFVPWIMFSVANYIAVPIVSNMVTLDVFKNSMMIENIVAGVIAVVSGFLADRIGRRRLVLAGFVLLGLGYASIGLLPVDTAGMAGWWFYTTVDGIAWGIFYTMFLMTLWGDMALGKNSEKFYAIGYLPFLFSIFTEMSIGASISSLVPAAAIFSFISFFLFIAVLPLAYAPETLPHQVVKNRELQNYVEKAQRAAESSGSN